MDHANGRIVSSVEHNGFEMQFVEDDSGQLWGRVLEIDSKIVENKNNIDTSGVIVASWRLGRGGA